jgi:hypothetical protein
MQGRGKSNMNCVGEEFCYFSKARSNLPLTKKVDQQAQEATDRPILRGPALAFLLLAALERTSIHKSKQGRTRARKEFAATCEMVVSKTCCLVFARLVSNAALLRRVDRRPFRAGFVVTYGHARRRFRMPSGFTAGPGLEAQPLGLSTGVRRLESILPLSAVRNRLGRERFAAIVATDCFFFPGERGNQVVCPSLNFAGIF